MKILCRCSISCGLLIVSLPCATIADAQTVPVPPDTNWVIHVEATPLSSAVRPGPSLLKEVPGLTVRDQGAGSPQADLSVRGSPFNSTGLLLNGLTLRNAQTEHWHADMPAPDVWFDTPTVLTGLDRFRTARHQAMLQRFQVGGRNEDGKMVRLSLHDL